MLHFINNINLKWGPIIIAVPGGGRGQVRNFRAVTMINCKKWLPNSGEDLFLFLFYFFREHLDFGTKIEKYETDSK